MEKTNYEKTRKKKKVCRIVATSSTAGMVALGIVAFLGRHVGTFTVALEQKDVKLAFTRKATSDAEKSSYLYIDSLPTFQQYRLDYIQDLTDVVLDTDTNEYNNIKGGIQYNYGSDDSALSMRFFKYTFYVTNAGEKTAGYDINFNITDDQMSTDGTKRYLSDTLRVMIFENDVLTDEENNVLDDSKQTHYYKVYAKPHQGGRKDENGKLREGEYKSMSPEQAEKEKIDFQGFAEDFVMNKTTNEIENIATSKVDLIRPGEFKRYTFICWIDGFDDDDLGLDIPTGATLKLGIKVNGYESKIE